MRKIPCIFLAAVLMLYACKDSTHFAQKLDTIDTLITQHPDSAYRLLTSMHDDASKQGKRMRMRYALTMADAQNKAYIDFTTDSVMKQVAEYYNDHGTPNEQMRAYYLLGCTYRDMGDAPTELEYFQRAVESADTTANDCDYKILSIIYGQMANIYHYQLLPEYELNCLKKCEELAYKSKDTLTAVIAYEHRIGVYVLLNQEDSILSISANARKKYLELNNKQYAAAMLNPAISVLLKRNEYEKAKRYMQIFEKESGYIDANGNINPKAGVYLLNKGMYALYCNQIDSARIYFHEKERIGKPEGAYEGLLALYSKINIPDSIAKYASLYAKANDSSTIKKHAATISQMTAMYDYSRINALQAKNAFELYNVQKKLKGVAFALLFTIIIIGILMFIYERRRRKSISQITSLLIKTEHTEQLLKEAREESQRESIIFNRTITDNIHKDDIIAQLKENHRIASVESEKKIIQLEQRLYDLKERLHQAENGIIQESFFNSDIYAKFAACGKNGKQALTEQDWKEMSSKFKTLFHEYHKFLQCGNTLTESQYKVCILLRFGFKEGDIANIMDTNNKRISKIKVQINEKLFNCSDAKSLKTNLKEHF